MTTQCIKKKINICVKSQIYSYPWDINCVLCKPSQLYTVVLVGSLVSLLGDNNSSSLFMSADGPLTLSDPNISLTHLQH